MLTGRAECEMISTVDVELDAADVGLHGQRCHRVFHVCVP